MATKPTKKQTGNRTAKEAAKKPARKSARPAAKAAPEALADGRLIVVSNRVPDVKGGKVQAGGLAVALEEALLAAKEGVWFGWSGRAGNDTQARPEITEAGPITYITLDLSWKAYNEYYNGFANRALWPLFHYRIDLATFSREHQARYIEVNTMFADELTYFLRPGDTIWIHDYHLIPLGQCLRRHGHDQTMGIFLHTPFPATEVLIALPTHRELVQALSAYDLIGFQTENDKRAFADYIQHEARGSVTKDGQVTAFGRKFRIGVFPIGINPEQFEGPVANPKQMRWARDLKERSGDGSWLIGVDRIDYSKGISQRFAAYLCADFPDLSVTLCAYAADQGLDALPARAAVCAAGPVEDGRVRLTNHPWNIDAAATAQDLGLDSLDLVNDFTAQAQALPALGAGDLVVLAEGRPVAGAAKAVIGPGTGLGVAALLPERDGLPERIAESEAGHMTLAACNDADRAVVAALAGRFRQVSLERILSGPGLENLYRVLSDQPDRDPPPAAEITERALAGGDVIATRVLERFFEFLGSACGDLVLALDARAGLYLSGGILPRMADALMASGFHRRFIDNVKFGDYLAAVPVALVTHPDPAFLGSGACSEEPEPRNRDRDGTERSGLELFTF